MAITFNSIPINTVTFNGINLSSVTFNGAEVFDDWVDYSGYFPNSNAKLSSSSSPGNLGFALKRSLTPSSGTTVSNTGDGWYPLGNGAGTEMGTVYDSDGGGYYTIFWGFKVPDLLGTIIIKELKIENARNFYSYNVYSSADSSAFSAMSRAFTQSEFPDVLYTKPGVNVLSNFTATVADLNTEIAALKIVATQPNSSFDRYSEYGYIGRISFKFAARKNKLAAWKSAYGIS